LLVGRTSNNTGITDVFPFSTLDQFVKHWFWCRANLKLHYFVVEETEQVAENEYKVYSRMDLGITNADKTTDRKKLKKVFTVHDDGKVRRIKNIEQM
jgi:hypothetical protein